MNTSHNFDVNAAYPAIASRLRKVEGVRDVRGVNDLAQALNGHSTGSHGFVYLVFDGIQPKHEALTGKQQTITVTYSVFIAAQTYDRNGMPQETGLLIGRVMQALAGFAPLDDDPRSRQVLQQVNAERSAHAYGLSIYPLKYQLDIHFRAAKT